MDLRIVRPCALARLPPWDSSIGVHFGWNLGQGTLFGFPVSGDKEIASVIAIQQRGPVAMTGGAFGPEAGLVGVAASLAGIAAIALYVRKVYLRNSRDASLGGGAAGQRNVGFS